MRNDQLTGHGLFHHYFLTMGQELLNIKGSLYRESLIDWQEYFPFKVEQIRPWVKLPQNFLNARESLVVGVLLSHDYWQDKAINFDHALSYHQNCIDLFCHEDPLLIELAYFSRGLLYAKVGLHSKESKKYLLLALDQIADFLDHPLLGENAKLFYSALLAANGELPKGIKWLVRAARQEKDPRALYQSLSRFYHNCGHPRIAQFYQIKKLKWITSLEEAPTPQTKERHQVCGQD